MSIIDATRPGNVHSADGWGDVLNRPLCLMPVKVPS